MVDWHDDQAAGLRKLVMAPVRRVIAFFAQNPADSAATVAAAALELTFRGARVLVIDEQEGQHGCAAHLGCATRFDLLQAARGDVSIERARVCVTSTLSLLPAARASRAMHEADARVRAAAARCVDLAEQGAEYVLIHAASDSAAAQRDIGSVFARAANRVLLCAPGTPNGMTDCYALLKRVHAEVGHANYGLVLTRMRDARLGAALIDNLRRVAADRLSVELDEYGCLPVPRGGNMRTVLAAAPVGAAALADKLAAVHPITSARSPARESGVLHRLIARAGLDLRNTRPRSNAARAQ